MKEMTSKLINKSIEAFVMGIEIYNKPTLKYRVEGFSFFICNAWELLLKGHLIETEGEGYIYYEETDRTFSLEKCVKEVFTNDKDPLRVNLEKIIELRNTSTHFITEEYEIMYVPLFQACVLNYEEKLFGFFELDINDYVSHSFLNLSVSFKHLSDAQIREKYSDEIAEKFLHTRDKLEILQSKYNQNFSITVEHRVLITKNKEEADSIVALDKESEDVVGYIREIRDPKQTHKYTTGKAIELINRRITKEKIPIVYSNSNQIFTSNDFQNFAKYFGLKENPKYCYRDDLYTQPRYSYSMQTIDFIVDRLKDDPKNILDNIKKITPGAKEF